MGCSRLIWCVHSVSASPYFGQASANASFRVRLLWRGVVTAFLAVALVASLTQNTGSLPKYLVRPMRIRMHTRPTNQHAHPHDPPIGTRIHTFCASAASQPLVQGTRNATHHTTWGRPLAAFAEAVGLDQEWGMFAPPPTEDFWIVIEATNFANETFDLFRDRGYIDMRSRTHVDWNPPLAADFAYSFYNHRWYTCMPPDCNLIRMSKVRVMAELHRYWVRMLCCCMRRSLHSALPISSKRSASTFAMSGCATIQDRSDCASSNCGSSATVTSSVKGPRRLNSSQGTSS